MSTRLAEPIRSLPRVPPLEHGDRLTGAEFERRWKAMPELKKAELLDGMVYIVDDFPSSRLDPRLPPLQNGDRLDWDEFVRRWDNMPELKRAELINGEVFLSPPVSATYHGIPHSELMYWLMTYQ